MVVVFKLAYMYILYQISVKENHIYKGKSVSPVNRRCFKSFYSPVYCFPSKNCKKMAITF